MLAADGQTSAAPADLLDVDFGAGDFFLPGSIAGSVYAASEIGGPRQAGDPGIAGIRLELINAQGLPIAAAVTDDAGGYEFPGLPPGTYALREHQPIGLLDAGASIGSGGGAIVDDNQISEIALDAGAQLAGYDFAERPLPMASALAISPPVTSATFWTESIPHAMPTAPRRHEAILSAPSSPLVIWDFAPILGGSGHELRPEEFDAAIQRTVAEPEGDLQASRAIPGPNESDHPESEPTLAEELAAQREARDQAFHEGEAAAPPRGTPHARIARKPAA